MIQISKLKKETKTSKNLFKIEIKKIENKKIKKFKKI
jgi:hypothetical protein